MPAGQLLPTCQVFEWNCNTYACCLRANFKDMGAAAGLLVSLSCYRKNCLVSDLCTGPVPHNQTCLMVNMYADSAGMVAGLLVWCK